MIITIGKPCAITEKGGRSNNEDSIYPLPEQVTLDRKIVYGLRWCGWSRERGGSQLISLRVHTNFLFYVPKG